MNAINEPTKSTTTLDYYNKNAKKIHHRHYICRLRNRAESLPGQTASGSRNLGLRLRFRPRYKIFSGARLQSHCHRRFTGTMQTRKRIYRHSGKTHVVPGVVSLKRLLNQSILKSWSSKMIKKSLEAYFFTLKNKIVFCKKQFQNMSVFCFVSTEIV